MGGSDEGEWVLFKNGKFKRNEPNNPLEVKIITTAVGALSNKTKAGAVVYGFSTGGTGFFMTSALCGRSTGSLKLVSWLTWRTGPGLTRWPSSLGRLS
jgi:hypothetical protein